MEYSNWSNLKVINFKIIEHLIFNTKNSYKKIIMSSNIDLNNLSDGDYCAIINLEKNKIDYFYKEKIDKLKNAKISYQDELEKICFIIIDYKIVKISDVFVKNIPKYKKILNNNLKLEKMENGFYEAIMNFKKNKIDYFWKNDSVDPYYELDDSDEIYDLNEIFGIK